MVDKEILASNSRSGGTFASTPAWDHFVCQWWTKRSHASFASRFGFCLNHDSRSGGTFSFHSSVGSLHLPLADEVIPCWLLCLQFITLTINNYDEVLTIAISLAADL